jgi:hypothetical protein
MTGTSLAVHPSAFILHPSIPFRLRFRPITPLPGRAAALRESFADLRETFAGLREAFAGLREAFAGLREVFAGLREAFAGLREAFAGLREAFAGLRETFAGLRETFTAADAKWPDPRGDRADATFRGRARGSAMPAGFTGRVEMNAKAPSDGDDGRTNGRPRITRRDTNDAAVISAALPPIDRLRTGILWRGLVSRRPSATGGGHKRGKGPRRHGGLRDRRHGIERDIVERDAALARARARARARGGHGRAGHDRPVDAVGRDRQGDASGVEFGSPPDKRPVHIVRAQRHGLGVVRAPIAADGDEPGDAGRAATPVPVPVPVPGRENVNSISRWSFGTSPVRTPPMPFEPLVA